MKAPSEILPERAAICPRTLAVLGAGWLLLAVLAGETHLLTIAPPGVVPALAAGLSLALSGAYLFSGCFRREVLAIPMRALLLPHWTRFTGLYFLYLHKQGALPGEFAIRAGWGATVIAAGAVVLAAVPWIRRSTAALFVWNAFGLAELLHVLGSVARFGLTDASVLTPFMKLPLSLLPTFAVPLLIATHVAIFHRLWLASGSRGNRGAENVAPAPEAQCQY